MAPKKRTRVGSSSQQPQQQHQQPQQQQQQRPLDPMYINMEAQAAAELIGPRPIIRERTMAIVPPQKAYIDAHGWTAFVKAGTTHASRSLVQEFYSNLVGQPGDIIFVRGREVDASAEAINRIYGLQSIADDGYTAISQHEPTPAEVAAVLTRTPGGQPAILLPDWRSIARGLFTVEAKNWAYFVSARLIPVSMGSEIHKVRALLTYAIVTGRTVDVGRVICREMRLAGEGRANRSLGFPSLITQLCKEAGIDVSPVDTTDVLKPQPRITATMYLPAKKAQRRMRAVESDDEDDHEAEQLHQGGDQQHQDEGAHQEQRHDQQEHHAQPPHQPSLEEIMALMRAQHEEQTALMQQCLAAVTSMDVRVSALEARFPPPPP